MKGDGQDCGTSPRVSGFAGKEIRRRCAQVVHGGDAPVRSGDGQVADGVQNGEGVQMAWLARSGVS
jgi:hypothetical protein